MQASEKLSTLFPASERIAKPQSVNGRTSASRFLIRLHKIADILIATASVPAAFIITNLSRLPDGAAGFLALRVSVKNLLLISLFALIWSGICHAFDTYKIPRQSRELLLRATAASVCGGSFILIFVITSRAGLFGLSTALLAWVIAVLATIGVRIGSNALMGSAASQRHPRQVLIVGSGARALRLYRQLSNGSRNEYQVLGFVDTLGGRAPHKEIHHKMLGDLAELEDILVGNVVDEVLITLPVKSCYTQIEYAISVAEKVGVESKYLSEIFQSSLARIDYERLEGFPVTSLKPVVDDARLMVKRAIDLTGAITGILVLSPVFVFIAVSISLTNGGPVFFSQERYGRNKRRFRMHKFRTMVRDAEALQEDLECRNEMLGPMFKIKEDPRITRLGRMLRRTSLDELPQLINVLKGEMSLVGPRPLPLRDVSRFEQGWLMRRFSVTPGLTGLWQVNGRSHTGFEQWVTNDLKYIDNWSLTLDLKILIKTIPAVLRGEGAV